MCPARWRHLVSSYAGWAHQLAYRARVRLIGPAHDNLRRSWPDTPHKLRSHLWSQLVGAGLCDQFARQTIRALSYPPTKCVLADLLGADAVRSPPGPKI